MLAVQKLGSNFCVLWIIAENINDEELGDTGPKICKAKVWEWSTFANTLTVLSNAKSINHSPNNGFQVPRQKRNHKCISRHMQRLDTPKIARQGCLPKIEASTCR